MPVMWESNMLLKPMASGVAGLAWLLLGVFLVIGAFVFAAQKAATKAETDSESSAKWIPGMWPGRQGTPGTANQPQERREPVDLSQKAVAEPEIPIKRVPLAEPQYDLSSQKERSARPKLEWSLELVRDIEWKRFEDLCPKFYETKGIRSECTALGPDGGIDIRLYQDGERATSIVQCKAWGARFVGVKPVRELLGVMTHEKIEKAFFMTSGQFSDEAKEVAKSNRITLIDGQMLLMMIKRLSGEQQSALLEFATAGDYTTPTCPSCAVKMRKVSGKASRPDFWGCGNFPKCRQILGMRRSDQEIR
jgi:restriction system protein